MSKEQISKAQEGDLLSYLEEFELGALVRQRHGRYVLAKHSATL